MVLPTAGSDSDEDKLDAEGSDDGRLSFMQMPDPEQKQSPFLQTKDGEMLLQLTADFLKCCGLGPLISVRGKPAVFLTELSKEATAFEFTKTL